MLYMLDTNICIYLLKKRPLSCYEKLADLEHSGQLIAISSIVLSELQFGVSRSQQPQNNQIALNLLLSKLETLSYQDKAAKYYGDLRANLQRQGKPIGANDLLIAAHALSEKAILVTNNTKEFKRVEGLQVENWAC